MVSPRLVAYIFFYILIEFTKPVYQYVDYDPSAAWVEDLLQIKHDVICKMQPNAYDCLAMTNKSSVPRFYYDIQLQTCLTFKYYECPLSFNNYISLSECHEHCHKPGLERIPHQKPSIYCRLQPDFGDCNDYFPMFYFDISSRTCKGFSYSGCGGNDNRFNDGQVCIVRCSSVIGAMD